MIARHGAENVARKGDHEGMHDIRLDQRQVEALWPSGAGREPERDDFDEAFEEIETDRIPFSDLRKLAADYGLNLDHRDPAASNLAYELEGELKEAAANNRLAVWGRPYNGLVRDNDPLVPIPAEHFKKYSFRHGALHHVMRKEQTCTTTMSLITQGKTGLEGETFYDLRVSTKAARAIFKRKADERASDAG